MGTRTQFKRGDRGRRRTVGRIKRGGGDGGEPVRSPPRSADISPTTQVFFCDDYLRCLTGALHSTGYWVPVGLAARPRVTTFWLANTSVLNACLPRCRAGQNGLGPQVISISRRPAPRVRAPPRSLKTSGTQTCGSHRVPALRRQRVRSSDTSRTRGTGGSQLVRLASVSAIRALWDPLLVSRAA